MDREVIHQCLPQWLEHLRRHLARRLGGRRLAADVAQEAGARLLQALSEGVELREPRAWLFRVAQNLAVDEVRRRAPQPIGLDWQVALPDPRVEEEDAPVYHVAGRELERDEVLAMLPAAMAKLPARDRRWLLGYYRGGATCESLAREHGVTVETSKVRLHRARRRLAQMLQRAARLRQAERAAACAMLAACGPASAPRVEAPAPLRPPPVAAEAVPAPVPAAHPDRAPTPQAQLEQARALRAGASSRRGPERLAGLEQAAEAYALVARSWPEARDACAEAHYRRGEILRMLERDGEAYGAFLEALDAAGSGRPEALAARSKLEMGRIQRRAGRLMPALGWLEAVAGDEAAPLRLRNDAREEMAAIRLALGHGEAAAAAAAAWRADAESAAEEARAAGWQVRALRRLGRAAEAQRVLDDALERVRTLAADASPQGQAAARALRELTSLDQRVGE